MKKRSVNILGHQTSISLEEDFWEELLRLAEERNLSMNKMIAEIDRTRGTNANLSSAIRLYVLKDLKSRAAASDTATAQALPEDL